MAENIETLTLRIAQQGQIIEQYRFSLFNAELKMNLLIKMLEEKGVFVTDEFNSRWPQFLKNDVGIIGPDGMMEGTLKVTFYGEK